MFTCLLIEFCWLSLLLKRQALTGEPNTQLVLSKYLLISIYEQNVTSSVQSLSCVRLFATPWTAPCQASLHQLPEFTQTHVHWVCDAIQPSHPLSSPSLPIFNLSQHQGIFKWVNSLLWWPKCWSFSFSSSLSNDYSGLISFRIDWLYLLAVQGTLKSLLQHHSSKALILWRSAFFIVQLSHAYMTTGKIIPLTRQIWSDKCSQQRS